jgi:hypothetical protein
MGQNQILLIILGMIIIGVTIAVAITLVQENSITANRDSMASDLLNLSARAMQYYSSPAANGGGGHSFVGLTADAAGMAKLVSTAFSHNGNGEYTISSAGIAGQVVLRGTGNTFLADGTLPVITCTVTPSGNIVTIIN